MKRVTAILLLCLLILYHGGFYSVYWLVSHQIDKQWQGMDIPQQKDLMRISIPMKIPYKANQIDYSQTRGKIVLGKQVYRAIYQKYQNDSLHILIVNDAISSHLNNSIHALVKNAAPMDENKSRTSVINFCAKHYDEPKSVSGLKSIYSVSVNDYTDTYQRVHKSPCLDILLQPPIV